MQNKLTKYLLAMVILSSLATSGLVIESLPWWSFLIIIFVFGVLKPFKKWNITSFPIGFLSGFLVWFIASMYFDLLQHGIMLHKIGSILSVSQIVVLFVSGLIGGLLVGLAFYAGTCFYPNAKLIDNGM